MDTRVNSQSSCFTSHVPGRSELTIRENDKLLSHIIPAATKSRLRMSCRCSASITLASSAIWRDWPTDCAVLITFHGYQRRRPEPLMRPHLLPCVMPDEIGNQFFLGREVEEV